MRTGVEGLMLAFEMRVLPFAAVLLIVAAVAGGEELFLPMVAHRQGRDSAWWMTEVWIVNTTGSRGAYGAVFLPAGQDNLDLMRGDPAPEELGPGASSYRTDLVPEGGLGTLRFVTTPGVVVFARVYNAAGRESFGQGMAGVPRGSLARPGEVVHLVGLRRTPQFRSNLGLFSPAVESGTVRVRLIGPNGDSAGEEDFRLLPGGYMRIDDVLHSFGVHRGEHYRLEMTATVPLLAYASVVDARSGAPTLVLPHR